jgi:hypothetical protein
MTSATYPFLRCEDTVRVDLSLESVEERPSGRCGVFGTIYPGM